MLTQHRLRQVLAYDPVTGIFTFVRGRRKGKIAGTCHDDRGFLKVMIDRKSHLLHRLAWLWMTGTMPRRNIEHINEDHGDNRWSNLREGERDQKRAHRAPWRELTTLPGVSKVGEGYEAIVNRPGFTGEFLVQ
ncbi:MAG: HNH endonuclease [Alishewanella aestuarii]